MNKSIELGKFHLTYESIGSRQLVVRQAKANSAPLRVYFDQPLPPSVSDSTVNTSMNYEQQPDANYMPGNDGEQVARIVEFENAVNSIHEEMEKEA